MFISESKVSLGNKWKLVKIVKLLNINSNIEIRMIFIEYYIVVIYRKSILENVQEQKDTNVCQYNKPQWQYLRLCRFYCSSCSLRAKSFWASHSSIFDRFASH
jgi:hypothetical protein